MVDWVFLDLRQAVARLARRPGLTMPAVLIVAIGIGLNVAVFAALYRIVWRPLAFPDPAALVHVFAALPERQVFQVEVTPADYAAFRDRSTSFAALGLTFEQDVALTGSGDPLQVAGARVSPSLFDALAVEPFIGRTFTDEESAPGRDRVVVLSHGLWQNAFGADPGVLGTTVQLDGEACTVIGVMPPAFGFPPPITRSGRLIVGAHALWQPLALLPDEAANRSHHWYGVVGRLAPGVELSEARTELTRIADDLAAEFPDSNRGVSVSVESLSENASRGIRPALMALWIAVAIVLLVTCGNLAGLLFARAAGQKNETLIRAALGASRWRLVRATRTESLVLAAAGGAVGLAAAGAAGQGLLAFGFGSAAPAADSQIEGPVLVFALVVIFATALVCGSGPALMSGRQQTLVPAPTARSTTGRSHQWLGRSALVVAQVAAAVLVSSVAWSGAASLARLLSVEPGFDPGGVTVFDVSLPETRYPNDRARAAMVDRLLPDLVSIAGVEAVGVSSRLPFSGSRGAGPFVIEGRPDPEPGAFDLADDREVSPGYFDAMQLRVVEGRSLRESDRAGAAPVALVNETMARRFWPDASPVGQRIKRASRASDGDPWLTVVGAVEDVRHVSLSAPSVPEIYRPFAQGPSEAFSVVVRAAVTPIPVALVNERVWQVDPGLPVSDVRPMADMVSATASRPRAIATLLVVFAAVALAVAAVGVYGAMSLFVANRLRELGVRLALGASRRSLARMVLGETSALALAGLALGLPLAWAGSGWLESVFWGFEAFDPVGTLIVAAAAWLAAICAGSLPARRAAKADPVELLRIV